MILSLFTNDPIALLLPTKDMIDTIHSLLNLV